jgi:hypothetical protein
MRTLIAAVLALLVVPSVAWTQDDDSHKKMIKNALSAAPAEIAGGAKVMLPTGEVLQEGTNGWTCIPDDPEVPHNSPMCLDEVFLGFIGAWMNKQEPSFSGTGLGYMLQGSSPGSNVDPFATEPTEDNEWMTGSVPHLMMVVSDLSMLENVSTDPTSGGPWVMWAGTPYAHIMMPTVPRTK